MLLTFVGFERRQPWLAALAMLLGFHVKLFGAAAALLFVIYPGRLRFLAWSATFCLALAALPLVVVSPEQLDFLYRSWTDLVLEDQAVSYGFSVMGLPYTWFGIALPKNPIVLGAAVLLVLPLLRRSQWSDPGYRLGMLASILLWVVVFNHKAESPTFIIAMCGVGVWAFTQARGRLDAVLAVFAFVVTSLGTTDVFPLALRRRLGEPYILKVLPCVFLWVRIEAALLARSFGLRGTSGDRGAPQ
jgi:hypothetical protein